MTPTVGVDVLLRLADRMAGPLRAAEMRVQKAGERMNKRLTLSMKLGGAAALGQVAGVTRGAERMVTGFTDSIRAVERAKGELATLGVQDLDRVVAKGREMQGRLAGVTTDAFVRAAYDIKSGIASLSDQGVAEMTASAMLVAKATKGQAEQMTSLFATSYGIFKRQMEDLTDAEFGTRFGAALAASVQQFKTDGSKMQQAIESAGAGAANLGMAMDEQLALLGMMQQQMQAGEAGTALAAFARNAYKANEAFAAMKGAQVRLIDDAGRLREMPDILADLSARYGEALPSAEALAEIQTAFGSDEAMRVINALWGQEEAIRANSTALGEAGDRGADYTRQMAAAADSNWDATVLLLSQKIDLLKQAIGDRLLPVAQRFSARMDGIIERIGGWIDANPRLVTALGAAVAGIGALAAVAVPVLAASAALTAGWAVMSFATTRLGLGLLRLPGRLTRLLNPLKLVKGAFTALRLAMLSSGVGAIVLALAAGGMWIARNWDGLKAMFSGIGEGFMAALGPVAPVFDGIGEAFGRVIDWFGQLFPKVDASEADWRAWGESIGASLAGAVNRLAEFTGAVGKWMTDARNAVTNAWSDLGAWFEKLWDGVIETVTGKLESVKNLMAKANPRNWFGGGDGDEGPAVEGYASGGSYGPGWQVTGERGPELRYASQSGYIAHNLALRNMLGMTERIRANLGAASRPAFRPGLPGLGAAGAPGRALSFAAPITLNLSVNGAADAGQIRAAVTDLLEEARERMQVDARRMLHDG